MKLDLKSLPEKFVNGLRAAGHYAVLLFCLLLLASYGFLLLRIQNLNNIQPSPEDISEQVKTKPTPRIDEKLVKQLESLEDNSVSVKSLFNDARRNPFHE